MGGLCARSLQLWVAYHYDLRPMICPQAKCSCSSHIIESRPDLYVCQGAIIDKGREAVDQRDRFYKTPLMVAASAGNVEVVQFLLNNGYGYK